MTNTLDKLQSDWETLARPRLLETRRTRNPTVSPDYPVLAGEPTDFTASVNAYASQADRDAALAKLDSLGHFRGAQGPTWIVTCDEDLNAEKRVVQLTGGQQLGAIG